MYRKALVSSSVVVLSIGILALSACAPVGSEAWCKKMSDKPKGEWTANEAKEYTANCIFKSSD